MDLERLVRTHITTGDLVPPPELIDSLNANNVPLTSVVKALGEYLVSTEDDTRLKGLTFLGNIVGTIDSGRINRPATQTLVSFFSAKLDEFESTPVALEALTVLSKLKTFDDEAAVQLFNTVADLNLKAYVQAIRHSAYVLVDSLLALHRSALKGLGADFLNSYTKLVDGEKDPRNLMLLFAMDRVILLEFDVDDHIEDFFDVTFCYFPIMFKPPPNDPYGITAENLKTALRGCMSATPKFAKTAIPLFLEKFSTAVGPAMKDLLLSLAVCLPVYGRGAIAERATELWEGIKTEILYSSDTSIEAAALSALQALIRTMYPSDEPPTGLAQEIVKQASELLKDPEKNQAAVKIIAALPGASNSAASFAYAQIIAQLLQQYASQPVQRSPILTALATLVAACSAHSASPLERFRSNLLDTMLEGLRTDSLKLPALRGSVALVRTPELVLAQDISQILRSVNDIVINGEDSEQKYGSPSNALTLRREAVAALVDISMISPSDVESVTLPPLFHALPDVAPKEDEIDARESYRGMLDTLAELCIQPALFETLVVRILTKLEALVTSEAAVVDECQVVYAFDLLFCLASAIDTKAERKHFDIAKQFDRIVPRLHELLIEAAVSTAPTTLFTHTRLIQKVGQVEENLVWQLSADRQIKHLAAMDAAFTAGHFQGIVPPGSRIQAARPIFRRGATMSEKNLVVLYMAALRGVKPNVRLSHVLANPQTNLTLASPDAFLSGRIQWTIHETDNDLQLAAGLDLVSAYVNKQASTLQSLATIIEALWVQEIIDTEQPADTRNKALSVYLHIAQALALLRDSLAYEAVDRVLDVLGLSASDPIFVDNAAKGFAVIAKNKSKMPHLTAKLLYAQKMWNHVLPRILEGDRDASGRARIPYLVAFASLLPLVPASLCLASLSILLPLLVRSLSLVDAQLRNNALVALISVFETPNLSAEVDILLHQNAETLMESISRSYLPGQTAEMATSSTVRCTALRALALIPEAIRIASLQHVRSSVLKDLGKALDDPSRSVRREAVECRARWYKYGQ